MNFIIVFLALASPVSEAPKTPPAGVPPVLQDVDSSMTSGIAQGVESGATTPASETATPGSFWQIPRYVLEHGDSIAGLVAVIGLFLTAAYVRWKLGQPWRYSWLLTVKYWRRAWWRRMSMPIAQLYDYVALLTELRNNLEKYCDRNEGTMPVVFIFTRQLPSDWPLWDTTPSSSLLANETPLEKYVRRFQEFLARHSPGQVLVRRVIVLDNVKSPGGVARQEQLKRDADSKQFAGYIERLHKSKDDIWVWEYDRPWPGWLTDVVFYGVAKNPNPDARSPKWFWAVTSSYDAQEDLIVLQLHHNRQIRKPSREWQPLPGNCESLNDLVEGLAEGTHAGLRKLTAFLEEKADEAPSPSSLSGTTPHTTSSTPTSDDRGNWTRWEWHLRNAIQNADQLKAALAELGATYVAEVSANTTPIPWELFPVKITPHMLEALKQGLTHNLPGAWEAFRASFIPSAEEAARIGDTGNGRDGIGEEHRDVNPVKAITNFYENRVLFRVTAMCPAHCRYCFRRRMVTDVTGTWNARAIEEGIQHIASNGNIREVVLSGGDPLVLGDSHISDLLCRLRGIEHVRRVRIDTRVLTALPQRVTDSLINVLQTDRHSKPVYVVGHFSHAYELGPTTQAACGRLVDAGVPVLAHIPLLRGVNDCSERLSTLMEKLVDCRIRPYYLIQYIPTRWTEHFRVSLRRGCEIVRELHKQCSGLATPTYIVYLPAGAGKVPVIPRYVKEKRKEGWVFRTSKGPVLYPEPSS